MNIFRDTSKYFNLYSLGLLASVIEKLFLIIEQTDNITKEVCKIRIEYLLRTSRMKNAILLNGFINEKFKDLIEKNGLLKDIPKTIDITYFINNGQTLTKYIFPLDEYFKESAWENFKHSKSVYLTVKTGNINK